MKLDLSDLDRQRFGHVTARGELVPGEEVERVVERAHYLGAELVILRTSTSDLSCVQAAQRHGALLTDTLVHFEKRPLDGGGAQLPAGFSARRAGTADAAAVEALARRAFRGYGGHYHADPRLARQAADETYASWARRSCLGAPAADAVVVVTALGGAIVGFATLKTIDADTFSIPLNGVAPEHQGRGLYGELLRLAQRWGIEQSLGRLVISTQVDNLRAQRAWCRLGFLPLRSEYTLHLWIDR